MSDTAIVPVNKYAVVQKDAEKFQQIVRQNLGGGQMTVFDLTRVTIPPAGGVAFTVATADGAQAVPNLQGIIIAWRMQRVFWAQPYGTNAAASPPDCSSSDLVNGVGKPGGPCGTCPNAEWGSASRDGKQAKGQACKQVGVMLLLTPESRLPIVLILPVTSVKPARRYLMQLANIGLAYDGVVTVVGLTQAQNGVGIKYSVATFRKGAVLTDADQKQLQGLISALRDVMHTATTVVDAEAVYGSDDDNGRA